jgi:hypothetical protein
MTTLILAIVFGGRRVEGIAVGSAIRVCPERSRKAGRAFKRKNV